MNDPSGRFMRILLFFDLPTETNNDKKEYRKFVKFLTSEGYLRIQYSVYCKLCINNDSAQTEIKRVRVSSPHVGDIRLMAITENQFQKIININETHDLQEAITTTNRTLIIGGMNDEDKNWR